MLQLLKTSSPGDSGRFEGVVTASVVVVVIACGEVVVVSCDGVVVSSIGDDGNMLEHSSIEEENIDDDDISDVAGISLEKDEDSSDELDAMYSELANGSLVNEDELDGNIDEVSISETSLDDTPASILEELKDSG